MYIHGYGMMTGLTRAVLKKKDQLLAILRFNSGQWFKAAFLAQQLHISGVQVRVLIAYCCVIDDDAYIASSAGSKKDSGFKWATHPDELDHSVNDLHSRILKMTLRASAQERKRRKLLTQIEEKQTVAQL
jgi:hypothetical protein